MQLLVSLLSWANLPFTAAIGIVLTFAALQASGLLGLLAGGDHDADGDADVDGGADVDGDVDADVDGDMDVDGHPDVDGDMDVDGHPDVDGDVDGDVDHEVDHDFDHELESAGQHGGSGTSGYAGGARGMAVRGGGAGSHGHGMLSALGVGKIPTSIIWQSFLMSFGLVGVVVNTLVLGMTGGLPLLALGLSLPLGVAGGLLATMGVARTLVKVVRPGMEAPGKRHLVGCTGVVVSGQVDEHFGEIRVRAPNGENVQVHCTVRDGQAAIEYHAEVVVVEYDRNQDRFYVAPLSLGEGQGAGRQLPIGQKQAAR